jgi:hypothetical protein
MGLVGHQPGHLGAGLGGAVPAAPKCQAPEDRVAGEMVIDDDECFVVFGRQDRPRTLAPGRQVGIGQVAGDPQRLGQPQCCSAFQQEAARRLQLAQRVPAVVPSGDHLRVGIPARIAPSCGIEKDGLLACENTGGVAHVHIHGVLPDQRAVGSVGGAAHAVAAGPCEDMGDLLAMGAVEVVMGARQVHHLVGDSPRIAEIPDIERLVKAFVIAAAIGGFTEARRGDARAEEDGLGRHGQCAALEDRHIHPPDRGPRVESHGAGPGRAGGAGQGRMQGKPGHARYAPAGAGGTIRGPPYRGGGPPATAGLKPPPRRDRDWPRAAFRRNHRRPQAPRRRPEAARSRSAPWS